MTPAHKPRHAAQPLTAQAGLGLRPPHHAFVRAERPTVEWFEAHPENFMHPGVMLDDLRDIADLYPLSLHAVGLSLGSADAIDRAHLSRLKKLARALSPVLISDHLSWSRIGDLQAPDLLPLPYTQEALDAVSHNVAIAQDVLGRALLIENPSRYIRFLHEDMSEAEFLGALVRRTGCGVLFDINNLYVSARNAGLDPLKELKCFLRTVPTDAIGEIHLAGHAVVHERLRIDDHGSAITADVWSLFEMALAAIGPRPTLIEWDNAIPDFSVLAAEAEKAQMRLMAYGKDRHAA